MSVSRDYVSEGLNVNAPMVGQDSPVTIQGGGGDGGVNVLLQGKVERTNASNGKTATVTNGENIQIALDNVYKSGGGTVVVLPGTYVLNSDLNIPSGVKLEGASRDGVLIDCNTNYSVKMNGVSVYSTGTVTIAVGDSIVVGSGTTWTSDMVGSYILLDDYYYEITGYNSATSLDIGEVYAGVALSTDTYVIADPNWNPSLVRVTIFNSSGAGVECHNSSEPNLDDIYVYECGTGFDISEVIFPRLLLTAIANGINLDCYKMHGFKIDYTGLEDATNQGAIFDTCTSGTYFDSNITGNGADGIKLNDCRGIAFISVFINVNSGKGIEFVSNNSDIQMMGCTISENTSDGIKLTASSDRISISTTSITNNGGYGVNIAATTCDDNYIVAPSFNNNTSGDINDSGTGTVLIPTLSEANFGDGSDGVIDLDGTNTYAGHISKSGNTYTLLRNLYALSLNIDSGITLIADGYKVYVDGATSGSGTIKGVLASNGTAGSNGTLSNGGAGGAGGVSTGSGYFKTTVGAAGAAGQNAGLLSAPPAGSNGGAVDPGIGVAGVAGGAGGAGSPAGTGPAVSSGGAVVSPDLKFGTGVYGIYEMEDVDFDGTHKKILGSAGSGGGGGGGTDDFDNGGGGGGGGAGASGSIVWMAVKNWSGAIVIESIGGDGGDGGDSYASAGDTGGGGGGGGGAGGVSVVIYNKKNWTGSYTLTGGAGGAGGSGRGAGSAGSAGTTGTTGTSYEIQV